MLFFILTITLPFPWIIIPNKVSIKPNMQVVNVGIFCITLMLESKLGCSLNKIKVNINPIMTPLNFSQNTGSDINFRIFLLILVES